MMSDKIPSEQEVLGYFDSLSNWGRWGDDDQHGTLNFLSKDNTKRAMGLVKEYVKVSCSRPILFESAADVPNPPVHYMLESGEGWESGHKVSNRHYSVSLDYIGMVFHGYSITHVDSLAHFFWDGKLYNGRPAHLVSTSLGATVESIELASEGIVSRGLLVDVPMIRGVNWLERGEGVMPSDILSAEKQCGFQVQEGDVLFVRTGQQYRRSVEGPVDPVSLGSTACQAACLPLFHERGIAMLGSDTGNDVNPSGYASVPSPIHQVGIVAMGLWILDNANLEDLSKVCKERNTWEFMVSILPLKLKNTTGSPVNPIAMF
tara:strand:- start:7122 stop:8075 length:954 start_codon:yes stop_codon:yes gene_type:complete